jgi:hypothetical protein
MVFAVNENMEKRYVLFQPLAAFEVEHWQRIPNQNVHAIADADMLILTSPIFLEQAQRLADYHAEHDGLRSIVVNVNEIYNEFSTGTPDPTGIRDFVRQPQILDLVWQGLFRFPKHPRHWDELCALL